MKQEQDEDLPQLPTLCPISELLGQRTESMSEEELDLFAKELRDLQKDDRKLDELLGGKKKRATGARAAVSKKKMADDLDFLGL